MSEEELDEPWGLLVSTGNAAGEEEERIPVVGSKFFVGRDKSAELVVEGNKFVSSRHCLLERDEEGGKWVSDFSSNGTLLNGSRCQKHTKAKLKDGDVISIVFRRDRTDCNVVYRFKDLDPLESTEPLTEEEEEEGEEGDETLDLTIDYGTHISEAKEDTVNQEEARDGEKKDGGCKRKLTEQEEEKDEVPKAKKLAIVEHDSRDDCVVIKSKPVSEEKGAEDSKESDPQPKVTKTGSIEETLICQICQEMLHDCISLQPCMHSYCGGCYSEWMTSSDQCPGCRGKVKRINKNHLVNNLVEAFLRANPDRKRPKEDLEELDKKNKITKDMLYPKHYQAEYDYSDNETDGSDEDEDYGSRSYSTNQPFSFATAGFGVPPLPGFSWRSTIPGTFTCRQCPTYSGVQQSNPSHPSPPPFTCSPLTTNHVLCQCCLQPMPDRRTESDTSIPPQKCDLCRQAFCHMYWGCSRPGCTGCLSIFREMEFSDSSMATIINQNSFESEILKEYLRSQGKTVKDMLKDCCEGLDSGNYHCSNGNILSGSIVCHLCALGPFTEMVYQYRKDIPATDLPESVRNRPDCHWGKNCRTQKHNASHARRYNHICEQTRASN